MSGTRATGSSDPRESLQWLLGTSWRLGRLFGVEIRIFWTVFLVFGIGTYEFTKWPGVGLLTAAALGAASTAGLYVIVLTHEFGHAFAGRAFRVRTPTITMSAFGGLAHMSDPPPGPKADIVISIAGPATHAVWIGIAWALGAVVPPVRVGEYGFPIDVMEWLVWLNLRLAIFNLLPCFPMDGGRVLRGLLALRWHPNLASLWSARVGALGAVAFVLWGLHVGEFGGGLLLAIGFTNFFACTREMSAARWGDGPYREAGAAWELDPEGWKTGSWRDDNDRGERPARLGWLKRWRMSRRVRLLERGDRAPDSSPPSPRAAPRSPADDRAEAEAGEGTELDHLLDRVRDVGMSGLTDDERERLRSISQARRR